MQNPELAQPLIQELAQNNPRFAQQLAQNPEAIMQLLGAGLDDDEEGGGIPPGAQVIQVTEEERAAIERVSGSLSRSYGLELMSIRSWSRLVSSGKT